MFTPFDVNLSTKLGSLGAYVLNDVPSDKIPSILLPLISTCTTLPSSTFFKKFEKGIVSETVERLGF